MSQSDQTPLRKPKSSPRRGPPSPRLAAASPQARRQAAAILEVLAGVRRPADAAEVLGTSLPRYYQLEQRALAGLLTACEPVLKGPRRDVSRQLAVLERENSRLRRECDRQQALVRAAERALGLAPAPIAKPSVKGKDAAAVSPGSRRRRARRPTVRALKAVRALQSDDSPRPEEAVTESMAPAAQVT